MVKKWEVFDGIVVTLSEITFKIVLIERSKSRGGDIIANIFSLQHSLVQSRIRTQSDLECVSDVDSPKLATRPFLFEVVEWSEQLRSVT